MLPGGAHVPGERLIGRNVVAGSREKIAAARESRTARTSGKVPGVIGKRRSKRRGKSRGKSRKAEPLLGRQRLRQPNATRCGGGATQVAAHAFEHRTVERESDPA